MKTIHDTWVGFLGYSRSEASVVPCHASVAGGGSGRRCRLLSLILWLVVFTFLTGSSATAQIINQKLNGPFLGIAGDVADYAISADSSRVVYRADQDTDGVYELYSVPIAGGTATKLNGTLVGGGDVWEYAISPDSSRVVYLGFQETYLANELYSVPITGGPYTKLTGTLVPGCQIQVYAISADSSRVVYHANQDAYGVFELYSVPITGGTPVTLNGTLVAGGGVSLNYAISADSARVVYRADQDLDEQIELYASWDALAVMNWMEY